MSIRTLDQTDTAKCKGQSSAYISTDGILSAPGLLLGNSRGERWRLRLSVLLVLKNKYFSSKLDYYLHKPARKLQYKLHVKCTAIRVQLQRGSQVNSFVWVVSSFVVSRCPWLHVYKAQRLGRALCSTLPSYLSAPATNTKTR